MMFRLLKIWLAAAWVGAGVTAGWAQTSSNPMPELLTRPLSLADALNVALNQNGAILRGKSDLQAQYGIVIQTRAIVLPQLQATGNYQKTDEVESFPFTGAPPPQHETWNAGIQLVQTIYQGGQLSAAWRTAKLTQEQAELNYRTVIADNLLLVRIAYYDVLSAAEQITVEEASVKLLTQELEDQTRRFQAGTVPRFNVLRAEVELANERPKLIQARNDHRISKNNLVNLLGFHVPPAVLEDVPLLLTDKLNSDPYKVELPAAVAHALDSRSEILALRKRESIAQQGINSAKGGYQPSLQIFLGYGARNTSFTNTLSDGIQGYSAGARFTWNLFDGLLTQGKIKQATAQHQGSQVDLDNELRSIELEVRTDYSNFIEASEVLESQKKVVEEAEEALRLATARSEAGTGTQLDVLSAQTSLTQARSTQVQALHSYDVARARLERAIGENFAPGASK